MTRTRTGVYQSGIVRKDILPKRIPVSEVSRKRCADAPMPHQEKISKLTPRPQSSPIFKNIDVPKKAEKPAPKEERPKKQDRPPKKLDQPPKKLDQPDIKAKQLTTENKPQIKEAVKNETKPIDTESQSKLNALFSRVLESELQKVMIKVWQEFPDDRASPAEHVVAQQFREEAGEDLRKILGLNVSKRLLNVFNKLFVKVQFQQKPGEEILEELTKKYNIKSFKHLEGRNGYIYVAEVRNIHDFDLLCSGNKNIGNNSIIITPCYRFRDCPPNLQSAYAPKITNSTDIDKEKLDESINKYLFTSQIQSKDANKTAKTAEISTTKVSIKGDKNKDAMKGVDTMNKAKLATQDKPKVGPNTQTVTPNKTIVEAPNDPKAAASNNPKAAVTNNSKAVAPNNPKTAAPNNTKAAAQNNPKAALNNSKVVTPNKSIAANNTKAVTPNNMKAVASKTNVVAPNTTAVAPNTKTVTPSNTKVPNKTQVATQNKAQVVTPNKSKAVPVNKSGNSKVTENKTKPKKANVPLNITKKKPPNNKDVQSKGVPNQISKKPYTKQIISPTKNIAKDSTTKKNKAIENDNDELDDLEILQLLAGGVVLDECSGSDQD